MEIHYKHPYQILRQIGDVINSLGLLKCDDEIYNIYRGRTHNTRVGYYQVKDLPPRDMARFPNRMSPAGIPMFYGASDIMTAIEEIKDNRK